MRNQSSQNSKAQIKKGLKEISPVIYSSLDIKLAYLFGSYVSHRFTSNSDLDVAILFADGHNSLELSTNSALYQRELAKYLEARVDVVVLNFASPLLKYEVIRNGKLIFCTDHEFRSLYELKVYKEYEDYCYLQSFYFQELKKRLKDDK